MNPFPVMLEVLRLNCEDKDAHAALECSPCPGDSCAACGGTGQLPLSSLFSPTPEWRVEAPMIAQGIQPPLGLRDPLLRTVVVPMVQANRILADEERGQRRFEEARRAVDRCTAEDWKRLCLLWIDHAEKGGE